jgi:hypothetical protein
MRGLVLIILGLGCIALGGLILHGDIARTTSTQTIDLGVIQASARAKEPLPDWTGFGALGLGAVLLLAGGRRKS